MVPPVAFREWLRGRPEAALFDLATLPLRGDRDREPAATPPELGDLPDPPAGGTLPALLATAYGVDPEQVLVTAGPAHATLLAFAASIEDAGADPDGDDDPRVLVEKVGPDAHRATPAWLGATVDQYRRGEEDELDPGRVASAVLEDTTLVAVSNRHDPTGRLADRETLAETAQAAREGGATLLVDERLAGYGSAAATRTGPFGAPTAAGLDGVAVVGSLSHFPGFPGPRVGWLVGPPPFVEAARRVETHVPVVADTSVALGARAVHNADDLAARSRDLAAANATVLADFVAETPAFSGHVAKGCPVGFLAHDRLDGDAVAAAAGEAGVLVAPGRFFGDPDRVRVALGGTPEDAAAGLRTLAGAVGE